MSQWWNHKRAARLGFLAGRGMALESIMADAIICARSERAVRCAASRWGIPLGMGSPFAILLSATDRLRLNIEAGKRGLTPTEFAVEAIQRALMQEHHDRP